MGECSGPYPGNSFPFEGQTEGSEGSDEELSHGRSGGGKILGVRGQDIICEIIFSRYNRKAVHMNSQQYGFLNKTYTMKSVAMAKQIGEISQGPQT